MNKSIVFKILYYICFIFSVIVFISALNSVNIFGVVMETATNVILALINLILVIVFSIKVIKNKLDNINILFPILYLIFSVVIIVLVLLMNNKLMIPYIHYGYYLSFILFNYLLLNIYCALSFTNQNKKNTV